MPYVPTLQRLNSIFLTSNLTSYSCLKLIVIHLSQAKTCFCTGIDGSLLVSDDRWIQVTHCKTWPSKSSWRLYLRTGFHVAESLKTKTLISRVCAFVSTTFIFTLHRSLVDGSVMFDRITETIDNIFFEYTSVNFNIYGESNIQHIKWLVHSNNTDDEGRHCWNFSVAYKLSHIMFIGNRTLGEPPWTLPHIIPWKRLCHPPLMAL